MRLVVVWYDEKFIVSTLNTNSRKMNLPFECNKRWPGFKAVPADFLSKVPNWSYARCLFLRTSSWMPILERSLFWNVSVHSYFDLNIFVAVTFSFHVCHSTGRTETVSRPSWFRVQGSRFMVYGLWFRVQGSGFRAHPEGPGSAFGFRVSGFGVGLGVGVGVGVRAIGISECVMLCLPTVRSCSVCFSSGIRHPPGHHRTKYIEHSIRVR